MVRYNALEELDVEIIDGDRGKNYPNEKELFDDGYCLFLSAKNVTSNGFEFATKQYISEEKDKLLRNGKLCRNDIVITTRGTVGNVAYYSNKVKYDNLRINSGMLIVRPKNNYNTKYLYYVLKSDFFAKQIHAIQTGSAQPQLPKSHFQKMKIPVFEKKTQDKIAYLLSLIDERIDNNNKINKNLEEQTYAIFNNSFPNISQGNSLVGDYIIPKRGKNLLSKDAVYGEIPVVAGGIFPSTFHNTANTSAPVITISASGANAGFVNLWHCPVWSSDSSYIDDTVSKFIYFWYILLKQRQQEIFDSQTGSAQPHIYPQHIASLKINKISNNEIKKYNDNVKTIFCNIGNLIKQNEKLIKLRDSLLPKLMSGEIDVSKIDI